MIWWVLAALAVAVVPPVVLAVVAARRQRGPLSADYCRICDEQLTRGATFEVRSSHESDPEPGGGTFMAVTYCQRHAPRGAVRT